jgi:hypothetical protein
MDRVNDGNAPLTCSGVRCLGGSASTSSIDASARRLHLCACACARWPSTAHSQRSKERRWSHWSKTAMGGGETVIHTHSSYASAPSDASSVGPALSSTVTTMRRGARLYQSSERAFLSVLSVERFCRLSVVLCVSCAGGQCRRKGRTQRHSWAAGCLSLGPALDR